MAEGVALIDLSPFTKLDLSGPGIVEALNGLTTARMDVPVGRAVYTQLLNARGGIEMDVTITRLEADRFHLTSGAATRFRDLAYLRRSLPQAVRIADVTEDFCTIGVMGAGSRALLRGLGDLPDCAFGHAGSARIGGVACRATRISFVGELGWELTVAIGDAPRLFDALAGGGGQPLGHFALDGCRLEKGFCHWGHELGPTVTPLEAGLGFTIDWTKQFQGKAVLERQRAGGLRHRLVLMRVAGAPLLLHDEPVFERGRCIGLTTSGGRGPRTGLDLCFARIGIEPGETPDDTCGRTLTLRVAGRDHAAKPLRRPPFDPAGERMRA